MEKVKVSPKYQVVIPLRIRKHLDISPGEELIMIEKGGVVHMVKVGNIRDLKGKFQDISQEGVRDEEDRY
jgi:AbrB family looped-hinge helix DNA binding protein